jgi:hypothetical protein
MHTPFPRLNQPENALKRRAPRPPPRRHLPREGEDSPEPFLHGGCRGRRRGPRCAAICLEKKRRTPSSSSIAAQEEGAEVPTGPTSALGRRGEPRALPPRWLKRRAPGPHRATICPGKERRAPSSSSMPEAASVGGMVAREGEEHADNREGCEEENWGKTTARIVRWWGSWGAALTESTRRQWM